MEQAKQLRVKRGSIKAQITNFHKYLNSLEAAEHSFISELRIRKTKCEALWDTFQEVQTEIEVLENASSEVYIESKEREEIEDHYFKVISLADEIIDRFAGNQSNSTHALSSNQNIIMQQPVRLPEISLPKFSGSFDHWYNFYNSFNSLIHSNDNLTKIQKMQYLKSALHGEASEVLLSMDITEDNYDSAWQLLKDRYDNKRLIIIKHIRSILDLPYLQKENFASLRQLLDNFNKHTRILKSLECKVDNWDDMLIVIVTSKFDQITGKEWESLQSPDKMPTVQQLLKFLTNKCQVLEALSRKTTPAITTPNKQQINAGKWPSRSNSLSHISTENKLTCLYCHGSNHVIYNCTKFQNLNVDQRFKHAKDKGFCINCLRKGHNTNKCTASSCRKCHKRHHTLLHLEASAIPNNSIDANMSTSENVPTDTVNSNTTISTVCRQSPEKLISTQCLLATAIVQIFDNKGKAHSCRVLLDSGSQSCFITEDLIRKLGVPVEDINLSVSGVNNSCSTIKHAAKIKLKSMYNNFQTDIQCFLLNQITDQLPLIAFDKNLLNIPSTIKLADPSFHKTSNIDMLLGADIFWKILCVGQIKTGAGQPYLQKTQFGWIISGSITINNDSSLYQVSCQLVTSKQLDFHVKRFWEIEEISAKPPLCVEERNCEIHFETTVTRDANGRFIVKLPLKSEIIHKIGETKHQALRRFQTLERKFDKQPSLQSDYSQFINEYIKLGHMKLSPENASSPDLPIIYLPHHAIIKESSVTTKLRVVFDGSAKSDTGVSLNDALMLGPTIQQDLISIILRFRTHKYVLTADIAKMYRQVKVDEAHTQLQRIIWRNSRNEDIKSYDLLTLTYGTTSASYLAIRVIHELAEIEGENFPTAAQIARRDFYVDDLLTGANTIDECDTIRDELINMFSKAGFQLRKWISNCPKLTEIASSDDQEHMVINLDKNENVKTLGLSWNAKNDTLHYTVSLNKEKCRITKRTILSNISKLFDPLGLLGPVIVVAKLLMQQLWQLNLTWDESVPTEIHTKWKRYSEELHQLNILSIPRGTINVNNPIRIELHGFCDSSESAYGACVYIRVINNEECSVQLMCSKSRVAPLKSLSLPKLELCGALLLAHVLTKVRKSIAIAKHDTYCWTDSTIVLAWIQSTSRMWKTFVANRVSEIQELTSDCVWQHISTDENPADIISRGCTATELLASKLWWSGPNWLSNTLELKSENIEMPTELPEQRISANACATTVKCDMLTKFSSFNRLVRVTAYCLRFINNARKQRHTATKSKILATSELNSAHNLIIRRIQQESFQKEMQDIKTNGQVDRRNKLLSLNPFIDTDGLLRVGGRLNQTNLSYNEKHQLILPQSHHVTKLILRQRHVDLFHSGTQTTLASIRNKYWPINARNSLRHIIRKCVTCFKAKPRMNYQLMGDLPPSRAEGHRPFLNCGVDYFGPLNVREGKRRNSKTVKTYGVIFVCFAVKAVHLELVSDLTSETFIQALKRFIARRGRPVNMYSDNGTNFVGANRELMSLLKEVMNNETKEWLQEKMSNAGINWHFIPPRAPHFGGIWEAGVKSIKHHLRRVVGNACLTFEEMYTYLVQIESILNSRPLTAISSDPSDFSALTPSHFLIGDTSSRIVEHDLKSVPINRLSRWQYIEQLRQHFWERWRKEYLHLLQQRTKWRQQGTPLQQGHLVLIQEDNLPPLSWVLGRVQQLHPGRDGLVRAASVATSNGVIKRPSNKLCLIPLDSEH